MDSSTQTVVELVKLVQARIESHEVNCFAERERMLRWMNDLDGKIDELAASMQDLKSCILHLQHENSNLDRQVASLTPAAKKEVKNTSAAWAASIGAIAAGLIEAFKQVMG